MQILPTLLLICAAASTGAAICLAVRNDTWVEGGRGTVFGPILSRATLAVARVHRPQIDEPARPEAFR